MDIPFPRALDIKGNLANNWINFKTVWKNYDVAMGLNTTDEKQHLPIKEKCPVFGPISKKCGKSNHFARLCKTARMKRKKSST